MKTKITFILFMTVLLSWTKNYGQSQIVGWGNNSDGQITIPSNLSAVKAIGEGVNFSMALKSDNTVQCWGDSSYGQTTPPNNLSSVVAIAAGYFHGLAVTQSGNVVGWGYNVAGQVTIPSDITLTPNAVAVSAGQFHSVALLSNGKIRVWGGNADKQLNIPDSINSNIKTISAGGFHTLALKNDGSVIAWGNNDFGQCNVPSQLYNIKAIAAGQFHSVAVKNDGTVIVWGQTSVQQGNIPAGLSNVVSIAAAGYFTLALKSDGTVVGWGSDANDQISGMPSNLSGVIAIAAGGSTSLSIQKTCSAPVAQVKNISVNLNSLGKAHIDASSIDNGSLASCGLASLKINRSDFTCINIGSNNIDLTITDINGTSSTATAIVNIIDNVVPVVISQNLTVQLDAFGKASITATQIDNGSSDNCGIATLSLDKTSFNCSNIGANTVTLTATDASGNSSSSPAIVTVVDNVAPIAIVRNFSLELGLGGKGTIAISDINNGSYDNCNIANISLDKTEFTCASFGSNTVLLTVIDESGNSSVATAIVTVTDALAPFAINSSIASIKNVSCYQGSDGGINLNVSDGISTAGQFIFAWSNGIAVQNISNVPAGHYSVVISNQNGCKNSISADIVQPSQLLITSLSSPKTGGYNISCYGLNTGSASVSASGGVMPYSYLWNSVPSQTTSIAANLTSGNYSVKVADANGCITGGNISLTQSSALSVSAGQDTIVYYGYTATDCVPLNVQNPKGGVAPYTFKWSTGITSSSITVCPTVSTIYYLTATDADGCTYTDTVFVKVIDIRCGNNNNNVSICFIPPGNPSNYHQQCVASGSVSDILAHTKSYIGSCNQQRIGFADQDTMDTVLEIKVFPNPVNGRYITITSSNGGFCYNIYTMTGLSSLSGKSIDKSILLDVNELSAGLYLIEVIDVESAKRFIKKILISK
jgi:alpha-tubulin suppressor-like RCC1 family protein